MIADFLEKLKDHLRQVPDQVILQDDTGSLTWQELDLLTGKVYAWLKEKGIGKEDMVMICLRRGIEAFAAALGVWRAGAAYVLVEDDYVAERIAFIREDSGSSVFLDAAAWEEIFQCMPLPDYAPVDPHAAAFAVYTSGTTGRPKGILHEYGDIPRMVDSLTLEDGPNDPVPGDRFVMTMPLNFVAMQLFTTRCLYYNSTMFVAPYSVARDLQRLTEYIRKHRINGLFTTPSLMRRMPQLPESLHFCFVGGEHVGELWIPGVRIHVIYGMSESAFMLASWVPDRKYEDVPAGYSNGVVETVILDEDGNAVPDGQEGEICFPSPYLRGYIRLPEEDAKHFRDGVFHTGDLGWRDEQGRLNVRGRLDDMVKINGNRVEPGEIEAVARRVFGTEQIAVKAFEDRERGFLVLYSTKPLGISDAQARKQLSRFLPYYMLPSYFVSLERLPLSENGKLLRRLLPKPDLSQYRACYMPPRDAEEEALCKAFSKVLDIREIGIYDDFYSLGGDSLSAMEVILASGLTGLSVADIFGGRTPEEIAKRYRTQHADSGRDEAALDEAARNEKWPLLPLQDYMLAEQQEEPDSTILNVFLLLRFDPEQILPEKLAAAAKATLMNHPSMLTQFTLPEKRDSAEQEEDPEAGSKPDWLDRIPSSGVLQHYCPESLRDIPVESLTEQEFTSLRDELVQPFTMLDSPLSRCRIFRTEQSGYLFLDIHHMLFDGFSIRVFMRNLMKAYRGEELERDYYYLSVRETQKALASERAGDDLAYYTGYFEQNLYEDTVLMPKPDAPEAENRLGRITADLGGLEPSLREMEKRWGFSYSIFFAAVTLAANAVYNRKLTAGLSWTYNGRTNARKLNSTGLYLCDLPLLVRIRPESSIREYLQTVNAGATGGMEHCTLPFTLIYADGQTDDCMCYLYQENLRDYGTDLTGMEMVPIRQNKAAASNVLDVEVWNGENGLQLVMEYDAGIYREESMLRFRALFSEIAALLSKADEQTTLGDVLKTVDSGWRFQAV